MLRRHLSWILAAILVSSVATACIVRTRPARGPVYVESEKHKHKKVKHAKHKHKHKKHH